LLKRARTILNRAITQYDRAPGDASALPDVEQADLNDNMMPAAELMDLQMQH
jgi:hypothetical protein